MCYRCFAIEELVRFRAENLFLQSIFLKTKWIFFFNDTRDFHKNSIHIQSSIYYCRIITGGYEKSYMPGVCRYTRSVDFTISYDTRNASRPRYIAKQAKAYENLKSILKHTLVFVVSIFNNHIIHAIED